MEQLSNLKCPRRILIAFDADDKYPAHLSSYDKERKNLK
jgi:hypothetical protein